MDEIDKFLDKLEDLLERASNIPLSRKVAIDPDEIGELIKDFNLNKPYMLRRANDVIEESEKIIAGARKEGEVLYTKAHKQVTDMMEQAQAERQRLINEHEITQAAKAEASRIVTEANEIAKTIRYGANEYADEVLMSMEESIGVSMDEIMKQQEELNAWIETIANRSKESIEMQLLKNVQILQKNRDDIYNNRQELRGKKTK